MTFYQELKDFFKSNDPQRLYMAKAIASKFKKGTEQKVVLNRLKVIYDNGGPANIVLGSPFENEPETAAITEESTGNVAEENSEMEVNIEVEIDIEGESPEVIIDTPDDDETKEG